MKSINELMEKIKAEKDFARKYAALGNVEAIVMQAKSDGYDVSKEDVKTAIFKTSQKTGELTETELAAVAGGEGKTSCPKCGSTWVNEDTNGWTCAWCSHRWST